MVIVLYVDDLILTAENVPYINSTNDTLQEEFGMCSMRLLKLSLWRLGNDKDALLFPIKGRYL